MTAGHCAKGSVGGILGQDGDDVLVERLAGGAGLLAAVEHGDGLDGRGQRGEEGLGVEGPIEADLEQADLLALARSGRRRLLRRLRRRNP